MKAEHLLLAGAIFNGAFAAFHVAFWTLFRWRADLSRLTPINRGVMQVLNLMLTYVGAATTAIQLLLPTELLGSALGRAALGAIAGFWALRAALQPFFFERSGVSWAFFVAFLLGAALHVGALLAPG